MKEKWRHKRRHKEVRLLKRFVALLSHPMFWFLTVAGNTMILLGSFLLYKLESHTGELQFVDCLLWSTSIVTTVGYVNYVPHTPYGKSLVIILMLLGTFFVWSYMAFLVSALLSPILNSLEKEMQDVEKEIYDLKMDENKIPPKKP